MDSVLDQLMNLSGEQSFLLGAKLLTIIGLLFYSVFSIVVIRQVRHMTQTLEVGFEKVILIISWLHLIFALGTLLIAFMIL